MTGPIDEELISHYPDSLKFISHNGAGYDQIDVVACAKRGPLSDESYCCSLLTAGIKVSNTPGVVAGATADVGIFLLLGALRNFNRGILELRKGLWTVLGELNFRELEGECCQRRGAGGESFRDSGHGRSWQSKPRVRRKLRGRTWQKKLLRLV